MQTNESGDEMYRDNMHRDLATHIKRIIKTFHSGFGKYKSNQSIVTYHIEKEDTIAYATAK